MIWCQFGTTKAFLFVFPTITAVTEAANEDQPTNGKTNWFWSWTQSSYEAWDQSGKFDKI